MSHDSIDQALQTALAHHQAGRLADAEAAYRKILAAQPANADTLHLLGVLTGQTKRQSEGIALIRQALTQEPGNPIFHCNLGCLLQLEKQLAEAIACFHRALALNPDYPEAHYNLGSALRDVGQLDQAIAHYQQAIALRPAYTKAHNNLGIAWRDMGRTDQAIACYHNALECYPAHAEAHNNLGLTWADKGDIDQAIACYQRALALKPGYPETLKNFGIAQREKGNLDEALACFKQGRDAGNISAHDQLLFTLHLHPASTPATLLEECRNWNRQHAQPLAPLIQPHANDPTSGRPLRIGYISADFRRQSVGRFMLPLLAAHNRRDFHIHCYAQVLAPDDFTAQMQSHADVWRNIAGLPDAAVADTIRNDRIDILVDLAMHTTDNRLLVFARKPAPIQVTYLAYASGTGVDAIDYRLTDHHLDPDPAGDRFYLQQSIRLPRNYWCYQPDPAAPPVSALPASAAGHITFACLNNFAKVTPPVLDAFAALLSLTANSRLLLHALAGTHRNRVIDFMSHRGISPDRLDWAGPGPLAAYFSLYHHIDIALDPFPYAGGTTTCDALWMGVPVVTLAGQTAVGRAGVSILSSVGLPELIAQTTAQYIQIAAALAADLPRLAQLRATLRPRMEASPLTDAPAFALSIEAAYRALWQTWCARQNPH